jgi:hypothetical protein
MPMEVKFIFAKYQFARNIASAEEETLQSHRAVERALESEGVVVARSSVRCVCDNALDFDGALMRNTGVGEGEWL